MNRSKKMLYVCDWLHHKYPQLSLREIATLKGTPYSTVQYNVKKAEKISSHLLEKRCSPVSLPPHINPKLEQADLDFIAAEVETKPDIYLDELEDKLRERQDRPISVSAPTICRTLNVCYFLL